MGLLTYRKGAFVFSDTAPEKRIERAFSSSWTLAQDGSCVTTDIKAAAQVRRFADGKAEKILQRAFVKHYPIPLRPLPPFLDSHQVDGVHWILTRSRSYLAHAPGSGKTCEAITASIFAEGQGQAIYIVPPELTVNWERETAKFFALIDPANMSAWPSISIIPDSRRQKHVGWKADFLIVPDSMLTRDWVLEHLIAAKKKLVAVDEASRFKEATSQRTIALFGGKLRDGRRVPGLVQDAKHAVLLDGSPMPNRPMELWAPTYAMAPEAIDFMSQQDFGFRYCGAKMNRFGQWEFKHSKNEDELRARLQKDFMHVVPEETLNHPERKRSLLFMNKDARSPEQKSWEQKHLTTINFDEIDEELSQGKIAHFRKELGLAKVRWVADYVMGRLTIKNEAILLFAWHREVCAALASALSSFSPRVVIGGSDDREESFSDFQSGKTNLLIGNILAMGRGHNLQRADRVIFGEYSWNDETNKQAEKRASRKGRDASKFVRCDYIVSPNSMDEPVLSAVFKKARRVKRVIG